MNIENIYNGFVNRLLKTRRYELSLDLQGAALSLCAFVISTWSVALLLESLFNFSATGRKNIFYGAIAISMALCVMLLAKPILRLFGVIEKQTEDEVAKRVGRKFLQVGDKLINTLELYRNYFLATEKASTHESRINTGSSSDLASAFIVANSGEIAKFNFNEIIDRNKRKRALYLFLCSVGITSLYAFLFPSSSANALYRLTHYEKEYSKPLEYSIEVITKNKKIVLGDSALILVKASGAIPKNIRLYTKTQGEISPSEIFLRADSNKTYSYKVQSLRQDIKYHVESFNYKSDEYLLQVVERPEITSLKVSLTPPFYTKQKPTYLPENTADISSISGTNVGLQILTNAPVKSAYITFIKKSEPLTENSNKINKVETRINMGIAGNKVFGNFRLTSSGEYFITVVSNEGLQNTNPIKYAINVTNDLAPSIELLSPTEKIDVDKQMQIPIQVRVADDYGFSHLRLYYKITASKYGYTNTNSKSFINIPIPQGDAGLGVSVNYLWDLTEINMVPEDEIEFYLEVSDNDAVAGGKTARTQSIKVRFPSFEEVMKEAEVSQAQANNDLKKLLNQAMDSQKKMEELNRDLTKQLAQNKSEASWEQEQKLKEVIKQHEAMEQKITEIQDQLKQTAERLEEARAISPETLQKYQDLQKLFEQIKDPELLKQLKQMQEAMKKMTPEQMAEAMKNFKFNEEQFRASIERTMKLLERMIAEQKVDELIKRSEEVAKLQEDLKKSLEATEPSDKAKNERLAEKQKDIKEQTKKLQEESQKLADKLQEMEDMPKDEMKEANEELQKENPEDRMKSALEQMQRKEKEEAKQSMEKSQMSAQKFREKMKQMKQKMQENSKREVLTKMKKAMQDMLTTSKEQEQLKRQVELTPNNSSKFRDHAREQAEMQQGMENIADQLEGISKKSFAITPEMSKDIGQALRNMQEATNQLERRNGGSAQRSQAEAMKSMNQNAQQLQQAIQQIQQGNGSCSNPGGMRMGNPSQQRLQQAAAQQEMLNSAMQQQSGKNGKNGGKSGNDKNGQKQNGKNGEQGNGSEGEGGEGNDNEGNGSSPDMKRLAREQKEVKKTIQDLKQEQNEVKNSDDKKRNMEALNQADKDIDEVIRDIESGNITPETLMRQQKILSRLLDAMKSDRERDFDNKRESKPGENISRESPSQLRLKELAKTKTEDQIKYKEQGFSTDYQDMIKKYLESVRAK